MPIRFVFVIAALSAFSPNLVEEITALSKTVHLPHGSPCDFSSQCVVGAHCSGGKCRKGRCEVNKDCGRGELCRVGQVHDDLEKACFGLNDEGNSKVEFCPVDGRPTRNAGGFFETCDMETPCLGRSICNPVFGVCCSKLRTCPFPRRPVLEADTRRPLICRLREGERLECPDGSECDDQTGFCCGIGDNTAKSVETNKITDGGPEGSDEHDKVVMARSRQPKHRPGDICEPGDECSGNSMCECENSVCRCECVRSMGYTLNAAEGVCVRTRRRLKERCKFDMDCQAAFSECTSGGCRCKDGFQRDGQGGCKPTSYRCVNHAEPLKFDGKVVLCESLKAPPISREVEAIELFDDAGEDSRPPAKDCPSQYYCVPIFDVPRQADMIQGFCCPMPSLERPVCPVGHPHSSSQPPEYGCKDCPWDHFCHADGVSTKRTICCPKPCLSPDDVYVDGQCYPIASHGETCTTSDQCIGRSAKVDIEPLNMLNSLDFETGEMECVKNVCECPSGFIFVEGACKRLQCTIGLKTEPTLDSEGHIQKCRRSSQCSQGQVCDPNLRLCCKGVNRCPKDYIETGQKCEPDDSCALPDQVCVRIRKGKKRICCKLEGYV